MNDYPDKLSIHNPSAEIPMARPIPREQVETTQAGASALNPQMPPDLSPVKAIAEIIFGVVAGIFGLILAGIFFPSEEQWGNWLPLIESFCVGVCVMLACFAMVLANGHSLHSIGWHTRAFGANVLVGIGGLFCTYIVLMALGSFLLFYFPEILDEATKTQKTIQETFPKMSFGVIVLLMCFVSLWEEVAFRGFLLTRLYALCRRWWLSIVIMAVMFGGAHVYEGVLGIAGTALLAVAMSILVALRKSLVPALTFHLIHNVLVLEMLQHQPDMFQQPAASLISFLRIG